MSVQAGPASDAAAHRSIAAATVPGAVVLTVSDLARSRDFHERVLGLQAVGPPSGDALALGAGAGPPLVVLRADPAAPVRDPAAPGLFHLAVLFPTRADLARALLRIAHASWPLSGASDHLVSEALYLNDPDGNGIELYHDRPRAQWPREDTGSLRMDTLQLDLHDLLADAGEPAELESHAPAGTRIGHVHLQVSDIARAEAFYVDLLGFDAVIRAYPGALFVSAGGYHHHLGLNTWHSRGAAPALPGAVGLSRYEIIVPDGEELARIIDRLAAGGVATRPADDGGAVLVDDPFGMTVLIRCA